MSQRTFTVTDGDDEIVFTGFNLDFTKLRVNDHVGLVMCEGEPEVYRLDNPEAAREVVRLYAEIYHAIGARCLVLTVTGFHSDPAVPDSKISPVFA